MFIIKPCNEVVVTRRSPTLNNPCKQIASMSAINIDYIVANKDFFPMAD